MTDCEMDALCTLAVEKLGQPFLFSADKFLSALFKTTLCIGLPAANEPCNLRSCFCVVLMRHGNFVGAMSINCSLQLCVVFLWC